MTEPQEILNQLLTGVPLSERQSQAAFEQILSGSWTEAHIGAMLALIASRPGGPTVDELVGGAKVMRRHVTPIAAPATGGRLIDTCGTGGAPKAFNVSTIAALVTAAAAPGRVLIAKHGSTSRTGRGSAELMQALGVNVAATPEAQTRCLEKLGVCFCFAIHHHPAMKHAAPARKALGFPTIFNLLGPLTNPAGAPRQLMGTYSADLAQKLAHTLARLGAQKAIVVTSHDGLDELTITDTNIVHTIEHGAISTRVVDARSLGLGHAPFDSLVAATLDDAVRVARDVLAGAKGPHRDMVLLNTAGALVAADAAADFADGISQAATAIDSGAAARTLDALVAESNA
ncbi:MAG: anthranilate phosphoribosyltransferase [Phycisphaeraceae bacterium]|nr:anthranilate phosphoribosyltransferase [Phycisphaeraceae bacterium]